MKKKTIDKIKTIGEKIIILFCVIPLVNGVGFWFIYSLMTTGILEEKLTTNQFMLSIISYAIGIAYIQLKLLIKVFIEESKK